MQVSALSKAKQEASAFGSRSWGLEMTSLKRVPVRREEHSIVCPY